MAHRPIVSSLGTLWRQKPQLFLFGLLVDSSSAPRLQLRPPGCSSAPRLQLRDAGLLSGAAGVRETGTSSVHAAAEISDWHLILLQSTENRRRLDFGTESHC